MMRRAGQAAHHFVRTIGTILLLLLLGLGAVSWRLSRGPVDLPILAARIGAAASHLQPGLDVDVGHAGLAWEGFHTGGAPLDLRLSGISLRTPQGLVVGAISRLRVTLSPLDLLRGSIAPIRIIARHPTIMVRPQHMGGTVGALPDAAARLANALQNASAHRGRLNLARLRLIRIIGANVIFDDPASGVHLAAPDSSVTLRRAADGVITGQAVAKFQDASGIVPLEINYHAANGRGLLRTRLGPANPAQILPQAGRVADLDLPLIMTTVTKLGQRNAVPVTALDLQIGAGRLHIAQGSVPIAAGEARLNVAPGRITLTKGWIGLAPVAGMKPGEAPPRILLAGHAAGNTAGNTDWRGDITATVDRLSAAMLPGYWPVGLAPPTRHYVVTNILAGTARDGIFDFGFAWNAMTGRAKLLQLTGNFAADNVTLRWLKGMPEMTGLSGTLRFTSINQLRIIETKGFAGGFAIRDGQGVINGLAHKDQFAHVRLNLAGTVQDATALLKAPRLHGPAFGSRQASLLLSGARGTVTALVDLHLPLKKHLTVKDITVAVAARSRNFSLPVPLGGLALHDGDLRVNADTHQATLEGTGMLGDAPSRFSGRLGFTAVSKDFRLQLSTIVDKRSVARTGLSTEFWNSGPAPLTATISGAPGGAKLALRADLADVALAVPIFGWTKPAGAPGTASLDLVLQNGQPDRIERVTVTAPGLIFAGQADGSSLAVSALDIGRSRASGKITPPAHAGGPWMVALAGTVLDLSGAMAAAERPAAAGSGVPVSWQLRSAFDHVLLRNNMAGGLTAMHIRASGQGNRIVSAYATGWLDGSHPVALSMTPSRVGQAVALRTSDGGALLDALGVTSNIQNGNLNFTAERAMGRMTGRAVMTDFRLRHAPLIGKILQGVTLYGVPEATSGPGLAFSQMIAPFTFANHVMTIEGGRAFSASLGLTTSGKVDFARKTYDLAGTIVPAYALNSLPGRIPLIGRLFRSAKGGGLFSARYTMDGSFSAPHIVVIPLAALAPGVLGKIFSLEPGQVSPATRREN